MFFPSLTYTLGSRKPLETTIRLSMKNKKALFKLKERRGETADSIVERLIESYKAMEEQMK